MTFSQNYRKREEERERERKSEKEKNASGWIIHLYHANKTDLTIFE